jgi:hypothetical protein
MANLDILKKSARYRKEAGNSGYAGNDAGNNKRWFRPFKLTP